MLRTLQTREAFRIPGAEQMTVTSSRGDQYRIMTWAPSAPAPAEGYPVMYLLDANASFGTLTEMIRLQTQGPHRLEECVIIGIGYETDQPLDSQRRFFDYTVQADQEELPPRKVDTAWPATGGADLFLAFIESELKPLMEQLFPLNRERQTLIGHSLGGWFTLYAMLMQRGSFQSYAAGSPSIWWKQRYIVPMAQQLARACMQPSADKQHVTNLYLVMGSEEKPHMLEDAEEMFELFSQKGINGVSVAYRCFEEEGHLSVIPAFLNYIVRSVLRRG